LVDGQTARARELISLLGLGEPGGGERAEVPASALKRFREQLNLTQAELANETGVSAALIQAMEQGKRSLSLKTARQLSGVLGTDAEELMLAEGLSEIARAALKGQVSPQRLLDLLMDFAYSSGGEGQAGEPDEELLNDVVEALLAILRGVLAREEEAVSVATKSARAGRDAHGRKLVKPHAVPASPVRRSPAVPPFEEASLKSGEAQPTRDAAGYRLRKPYGLKG
jgi:transcriptional regulator with XRE-family HTH domain